jgi:uncharacterized membrane protein YfcA
MFATIVGLEPWLALVSISVVAVGAALQASVGIGLGLLAAPILGIIDPDFIPAAIAIGVVPLTVGMAVREHDHIDRRGMGWAIGGRVPGVFVGAWVAAVASHTTLAVLIGISVLGAVLASLAGIHFPPSNRNLLIAGTASGFTGTATGIGGPPMALTYQHSDPEVIRSTLAAFFVVGGAMSITGLVVSGVLGVHEFELGLLLVPGVLAGLWASRYTVSRLPAEKVRPIVLTICAASALALLVDEVL